MLVSEKKKTWHTKHKQPESKVGCRIADGHNARLQTGLGMQHGATKHYKNEQCKKYTLITVNSNNLISWNYYLLMCLITAGSVAQACLSEYLRYMRDRIPGTTSRVLQKFYFIYDVRQNKSRIFFTMRSRFDYTSSIYITTYTVDSRYLEFQGTLWNTSRYPYLDISNLQNWGKNNSNNHI